MLYLFETTATMKEYNRCKWWIDGGIIRNITINADSITSAIKQYQTVVNDKYGVNISNNAITTKSPMYIDTETGDTKQVGYVITASTDFNNNHQGWVKQYIDLWVNISIIINPFGEVIAC